MLSTTFWPWNTPRADYVSSVQLPAFERKFLVGGSSSTVEGLATFVLSGKYTAYLPDHYARHWDAIGDQPFRIGTSIHSDK